MHFVAKSMVPGLLPKKLNILNNITTTKTTSEIYLDKNKYLKYKAAAIGEFEVISHDETFKTIMILPPQQFTYFRGT